MYKLVEISDKEVWNNFIIEGNFKFYSFLQSWEWGELQKSSGKNIIRYGINKDDNLIGIFLLIENKAKRGNYYFIPHGPLIKDNFFGVFKNILSDLKVKAKLNNISFIRLNSPVLNTIINKKHFEELGFINSPMHEHAEDTHLLNLEPTEEELLNNIKKKDRYYLNRAIKEGVEVVKGNTQEQIKILTDMHIEHSKKIGYHPFSTNFINKLYKIFGDNINTISTRFNGKVESILMTIKFGKTCVYYIATSNIKNPKFSPNYLCQWEAIKQAKADGCTTYNFWGISPDNNPKHPIAGVTKFKRKFAGYDYSLLHSQDLIISPKYWFNWIIESIRRIKRGYYYKKPE